MYWRTFIRAHTSAVLHRQTSNLLPFHGHSLVGRNRRVVQVSVEHDEREGQNVHRVLTARKKQGKSAVNKKQRRYECEGDDDREKLRSTECKRAVIDPAFSNQRSAPLCATRAFTR